MGKLLERLGAALLLLGPLGIFLIAFLDSSFLSIFEITDLLVVQRAVADPGRVWIAILALSLGSLGGCSVLYLAGRQGGEGFLEKRFGAARSEKTRAAFRRWDVAAVAVPAILPPPAPFKLFVFGAGVFGVRYPRFAMSVFCARALRYACWAGLGILYGREAVLLLARFQAFFRAHAILVLLIIALVVLGPIALALWARPVPDEASSGVGE